VKGPHVTLPVRRLAAVLVLGVALVTAGCGNTEANRAAVVDGRVIHETEVQSAMTQVNSMDPALLQQQLSPSTTLTALIQAPIVLDYLAGKGVVASETVAREEARQRGVADPSAGTLEIVRYARALTDAQNSAVLTQAESIELSQALQQQDVVVNPRYGEFDPGSAAVSVTLPDWVTPYSTAP
jgi:hypothetical protein